MQKPRRLGNGGVFLPGIPGPARVVIEGRNKRGTLVDAEKGTNIVDFPTPRNVSPEAGVIVLETAEPELVRLKDLQRVKPELEAAPDALKTRWLNSAGGQDTVVMLVEARDGTKYVAIPTNDQFETFRAQALPFEVDPKRNLSVIASDDTTWHFVTPDGPSSGGGVPWFLPHEAGCIRAQLGRDRKVRCIEHQPGPAFSGPRWMSDGWTVTNDYIAHPSWNGKATPFEGLVGDAPCHAALTIANPPRAYVQCRTTSALVAPDAVLRLDGLPEKRVSGLLGADVGPVVPLLSSSDDGTELWLDMEQKRVWQTPTLYPLAVAAFAGVGRKALAQNRETKEILVLDFDRKQMELLAKIDDCPGEFVELRDGRSSRSPKLLILSCVTPSPPNMVSHGHIWSEIVDLRSRTRHRTKLLPEVYFDDGVVVLSTRKRMSAESRSAPGEISSVVIR
jgi:hypothetical protein